MTQNSKIVTLNVYRDPCDRNRPEGRGQWCFALWVGGEYDCSDVLVDVDHDGDYKQAQSAAMATLVDDLAPPKDAKIEYGTRREKGAPIYTASWQVEA